MLEGNKIDPRKYLRKSLWAGPDTPWTDITYWSELLKHDIALIRERELYLHVIFNKGHDFVIS